MKYSIEIEIVMRISVSREGTSKEEEKAQTFSQKNG